TEVTDTKVKMDFNHPLAGKDVRFKGKILTVRDATPEELQPAHGCGCGCDHGSCGDDCGCEHDSCGDGCGCH
ncbi:MAG: peptidylprolyl isomerase, partial [Paramuribaculum sp.]|nr:peptidylprolyl isomerase [Paramuribaculum sp.]